MPLPQLDMPVTVAVIGSGSMGGGIAQLAAQAGHPVRLFDAQEGAAERALERISADLAGAVKRGRLDDAQKDAVMGRLSVANTLLDLEGCGLVVEAIVEKLEPKQTLFRQLEEVLDESAVLATNTSSISITAVAQGLVHPNRVIGWHFFNPAPRMKLVEVIAGLETDPALVAEMHALSRAWGKTPVDAPNAPGFIVNRVARPYYAEGLRLLAERLAPLEAIDRLMREAGGFSLGPFELIDLIGVDVNLSVTESVYAATQQDNRYAPHLIQQELVRAGHFGRKSGRGFYDYRPTAGKLHAVGLAAVGEAPALRVAGDLGLLQPLVERLQGAGATVSRDDGLAAGSFAFGEVTVALTDGRTATERAAGGGPLLLLDLARDYATTTLVGAAASAGADAHLPVLAAALQPAGIELLRLNDVAGLGVMRVVCGLANEAADLVTWTGTSAQDIDVAMVLGTAYPVGPLAWADAIGPSRVVQVLEHLHAHYGEARYRRSPRLLRARFAQESLHA
ncbi:3-hydroxyacyl-CoA dehydrogenase [Ideonella sp. BN130291]|uniref:3-hydroxyacyl-CoA dehydrogenase n=1 Tax=Ideonella sp. BN130291 TaxID=3112940 RepID=UPI002E25CA5B|nr:3-hydroxyacyl-CoA dehydrogenase [Ideonella sp. BN130291]